MTEYVGKNILVVGLGRSGLAAALYLSQQGANVTVTDTRTEKDLSSEIESLSKCNVKYQLGSNPKDIFVSSDLVVLSPGVPLTIEGVKAAREKNIPVVCEMELGLREISGEVIAITGTNGKSTTTALIGRLLEETGKQVWVGGNIGTPLLNDIEGIRAADYLVLELSSYQLEITPSLKPKCAVWLNVSPDHLDRYDSYDDYIKAKSLIGKNQDKDDWIIFSKDDPVVSECAGTFTATKFPFSTARKLDFGAWYEDRLLILGIKESRAPNPESLDISVSKLKGLHNLENIAAASAVAHLCGLSVAKIEKGLEEFKGLPHRLEFVRGLDNVSYYDDSKGTNVGAVKKSLESFDSNVILIAGGQDKNTGYEDLRQVVSEELKR